jgi:hypothetical protein
LILPTFALEPEALVSHGYKHCRDFSNHFGFTAGRLISQFPKKWMKDCLENPDLDQNDKYKIVEIIQDLKNKKKAFDCSNLDFDTSQEWTNNAIKHKDAFAGIIANKKIQYYPDLLYVLETFEDTPSFKVNRDIVIPRTAEKMALCARPLLKNSREIFFVDPYFAQQAKEKKRWIDPFEKFLQIATNDGKELSKCEYHFKEQNTRGTIEYFKESYGRDLENAIPSGVEVKFFNWDPGPNEFHVRAIITEVGGIKFDSGLDSATENKRTPVDIIGAETYQEVWGYFQEESYLYELVEGYPISIHGRKNS